MVLLSFGTHRKLQRYPAGCCWTANLRKSHRSQRKTGCTYTWLLLLLKNYHNCWGIVLLKKTILRTQIKLKRHHRQFLQEKKVSFNIIRRPQSSMVCNNNSRNKTIRAPQTWSHRTTRVHQLQKLSVTETWAEDSLHHWTWRSSLPSFPFLHQLSTHSRAIIFPTWIGSILE